MIEVKDVVIAGITSFAIFFYGFSSINNILKAESMTLTEKQKKRQHVYAQKELWEHAAQNTALGFSLFLLFVFTASKVMTDYHILLRLILSLSLLLIVYLILSVLVRKIFKSFQK